MPTTTTIDNLTVTTYSAEERAEGITKARLAANITLTKANQPMHVDDDAYAAFVCASAGLETLPDSAAESYYAQYADKTVYELEQDLITAVDAAPDYDPVVVPTLAGVPQSIPTLSALLVLDSAGLADAYEAWATSPDRTFAQRAFISKATHWRRDDPTLLAAAAELGLSDEQVDGLFVAAV